MFSVPIKVGQFLNLCLKRKVEPGAGDMVIMLDTTVQRDVWKYVRSAQQRGALMGTIVHDILPVTRPEFFPDSIASKFRAWFDLAIVRYDFLLAISNDVSSKIRQYGQSLKTSNDQTLAAIGVYCQGCDLDGSNGHPVSEIVRDELRRQLDASGPHFLSVSTLEPRKNYGLLLDAFDLIWEQGHDARLCIVGKLGWKCEDIAARIAAHSELGKRLSVFHDLTDQELAFAYAESDAFVFPTLGEGFGLPLVEALHAGLPVFASDIPVLREIGADNCSYFSATNPEELASLLLEFHPDSALPPADVRHNPKVVDWSESCRLLLHTAETLAQSVRDARGEERTEECRQSEIRRSAA